MKKFKFLLIVGVCLGWLTNQAQITVLHNFNGADGESPYGSLIFSTTGDSLYGMAAGGGTIGAGVVFSIEKNGSGYTDLFNFNDTTGAAPYGSLTLSGKVLYGMTLEGGSYASIL